MSREAFLIWSFTVRWCREGGILVFLQFPCIFVCAQEHVAHEWVRGGVVVVAIESPECVMRNVDAQRKGEREREATYDIPTPTFAS